MPLISHSNEAQYTKSKKGHKTTLPAAQADDPELEAIRQRRMAELMGKVSSAVALTQPLIHCQILPSMLV